LLPIDRTATTSHPFEANRTELTFSPFFTSLRKQHSSTSE
jgi:hypothetical protein